PGPGAGRTPRRGGRGREQGPPVRRLLRDVAAGLPGPLRHRQVGPTLIQTLGRRPGLLESGPKVPRTMASTTAGLATTAPTRDEVAAIYHSPLLELVFRAAEVHR